VQFVKSISYSDGYYFLSVNKVVGKLDTYDQLVGFVDALIALAFLPRIIALIMKQERQLSQFIRLKLWREVSQGTLDNLSEFQCLFKCLSVYVFTHNCFWCLFVYSLLFARIVLDSLPLMMSITAQKKS
jgi:hypothetical protein